MKYKSGVEIRAGDHVLYHGDPGEIEFIAAELVGDAAMDWYVREHGAGVLVREPKFFGRVYISDTENDEDLVFVGRRE